MANEKTGGGCLILFGAVFFFAGLVPGYLALQMAAGWWDARDWTPVAATIESTALNSSTSDGSTTYRVTARYRYVIQGRSHGSDQVDFGAGNDNIGSYHQNVYADLRRHQSNGEPYTAWVDPEDPSNSVLVRDMRWGLFAFMMVFPLVFSGVGAMIMLGGVWGSRKVKKDAAKRQRHPGQPWHWKDEWRSGQIRSELGTLMWFALGFAVLWNLISMPLLFIIPGEVMDKQNYPALIGLLFPVVGAGLASWALYLVLRWRKFGNTVFAMDSMPAPVGGRLSGELICPTAIDAGEMTATLSCIRRYTSGSGKSRSTREDVKWQDQQRIALSATHRHGNVRVPIRFSLPADARPSDPSDDNDRILWRLETRAEVPGVDYHAQFEVPVFRTGASPLAGAAATADPDSDQQTGHITAEPDSGMPGDWRRTGVIHSYGANGERFYFPPFRKPVLALVLTLLGVAATAGVWWAWVSSEYFVAVFVGIFALILDLLALWTLLHRCEIRVRYGELQVRSGLWPGRFTVIPADEIKSLGLRRSGSSNNTVHWDIRIERWAGRPVSLNQFISGRRDMQALAVYLIKACGAKVKD